MGQQLATCDTALQDGAKAPDWVHLMPAGAFKARGGRAFSLDEPQAVLAAFRQGGIDLPVDFEHQNDNPEARLKGPVPAAGWIKELRADKSGLWGRIEWTATAAAMIGRKEYRFISPTFWHLQSGKVTGLKGAALVHNPALHLTALAREERAMPTNADTPAAGTLLAKMAQLFDMPDSATESDVILKVAQLLIAPKTATAAQAEPDPAKYVPAAAVEQMLEARGAELATAREERVTRKVNDALEAGAFLLPLKDWVLNLGRADEAALDTFIAKCGTPFGDLKQTFSHLGGPPPGSGATFDSEAEAEVTAQLGLKPGALKG